MKIIFAPILGVCKKVKNCIIEILSIINKEN